MSAVYDADETRAKEVASGVGAEVAASGEALIADESVDAVLIAAPDPLHEQLALACLEAGRPTLCEKPVMTKSEAVMSVLLPGGLAGAGVAAGMPAGGMGGGGGGGGDGGGGGGGGGC